MLSTRLIGSALILGLFATYGCGDDDDDDDGTGAKAGTSGRGGAAGKAGAAGRGGTAGTSGRAGAAGTAGLGGRAGTGGLGGTSGSAGVAGTSGGGGISGEAGEGGEAGAMGGAGAEGGEGGAGAGGDAGSGGEGGADPMVERGLYLTHHVAACIDCHTPRNPDGTLDTTRLFAGSPVFADLVPGDDALGAVPAPNLTSHLTGLGAWTDEQIKDAFLNGVDQGGNALLSIMPYYVFHNMREDDADAIVAYLRTVPAIDNAIPERQPLPEPVTEPADPVPASAIPDTTLATSDPDFARAQNGRYLAGFIGTCMECHTADDPGSSIPIDVNALFAGGRVFPAAAIGVPSPPFPAEIYTRNLTPDASGIADYSVSEIVRAIRDGIDDEDDRLCPPMPSGPMQPFAGITVSDAEDIAIYLKSIEPIETDTYPECTPPDEGAAGAGGNGG